MTLRQLRVTYAVTISAFALTFSVSAEAAASRTFVSTTGNDGNASVNCSAAANCRTFGAALSATNSGGEIVVLNSGGYGPATIAQPVIITANGVDASISVTTSGADGLTINTTGNVTLSGLNLHGEGSGANGVEVQKVAFLRLYNMLIENFTNNGVDFAVAGSLAVYGSRMNDNGHAGLEVGNASAKAYVNDSSFDHNVTYGVVVAGGQVSVADSSGEYNQTGFYAFSGNMSLFNDRIILNTFGISAATGGTLTFAYCLIANNETSYFVSGTGTIAGTSPGSSLIAAGQGTTGTLSMTPATLQ